MMEFLFGSKVYHPDTQQAVADLLASGDLVALPVGSDKKRQLVITKWGKKLVKKYGVVGILNKSFLVGDIEEKVEGVLNSAFLSLDKFIKKPKWSKPIIKECLTNQPREIPSKLSSVIQAKVLSKYKTPLDKIWKIFYLNQKHQTTGYFLANDYQREKAFNDLDIGSTQSIYLVNGYKHQFLSKISPYKITIYNAISKNIISHI